MISRLPALVILLSALLTLLACGQTAAPMPTPTMGLEPMATPTPMPMPMPTATPTAGLEPVATEVVTPPASEATVAERDGDDEVKDAVQQLFDNWNRALRERDAALFHSLLTRELAGSCGLEGLQSWLDQGEEFLAEAEVRSVFLDVADPSRAFAEITARQHAGGPEVPLSFPWPVALEEGEWRAGFPASLTAESCPYKASEPPSGPEGRERQFPQIPGLDLEPRDDILAAVPGTNVVHGSVRTGNSNSSFSTGGSKAGGLKEVNIYAELETDAAGAELVRLYRDGLKHPSWDILDEGSSGEFGWFSWTVLDGEGLLWHGKLVVAPSHEGWRHVWLSLYSDESDEPK
jgi:hypothetical protein